MLQSVGEYLDGRDAELAADLAAMFVSNGYATYIDGKPEPEVTEPEPVELEGPEPEADPAE